MKIVLAHGTFDLLHVGHVEHFLLAAQYGELWVSVTADAHVRKGAGRPFFPLNERMAMISALACVKRVIASDSRNAVDVIETIRPAYYVKGEEYARRHQEIDLKAEIEAVRRVGGEFLTLGAARYSSTALLTGAAWRERVKPA